MFSSPSPDVDRLTSVGQIVQLCFEELCEVKLVQPTFVIDHPVEVSASFTEPTLQSLGIGVGHPASS